MIEKDVSTFCNSRVIYCILLALFLVPAVSAVVDTSSFLCNAATIQKQKTLTVGVGDSVETLIGFFNIHGTRTVHVLISPTKQNDIIVDVSPTSSIVSYDVAGVITDSTENLAVDPVDVNDLQLEKPVDSDGITYTKIDVIVGWIPVKFAVIKFSANKIVLPGSYTMTIPITIACFDAGVAGKASPLIIDRTMTYEVNVVDRSIAFKETVVPVKPVVTVVVSTEIPTILPVEQRGESVDSSAIEVVGSAVSTTPVPIVSASTGLFASQNGNLIFILIFALLAVAGYYSYNAYFKKDKGGDKI